MKMNNVLRRALALLLAITMCVGMISSEAFAAEYTENLEARELICGKEEHTHTEDCYAPADPESIPLLCNQEESDGHTHAEECTETIPGELTCPLEESEGHTHSEACEPTTTRDLICGQNELGGVTLTLMRVMPKKAS